MAAEKGPITTTDPPLIHPAGPQATVAATSDALAADLSRNKSLKRPRESTPSSPAALSSADLSPSKIARLVGYGRQSPALSPVPLTGAAALADERRKREEVERLNPVGTSENPSQRVLSDLLASASAAISRPRDAPPATGMSAVDVASRALDPVLIPASGAAVAEMKDASPRSAVSAGVASLGDADGHVVHSPIPMDVDPRPDQRLYAPQPEAQMDDKTAISLSYPGILPSGGGSMPAPAPPQRGLSLPMANSQNPDLDSRSPSSKKHKCPNCPTEFTRHHNLKSHMLTHSQEKPYVCQTCQMRFRRLHDLKRHSKLHTGEKPHICLKCDRKFARGDALARHSKGASGCAGRRASMGSFAADDEYDGGSADDSAVAGIVYDGNAEGDMLEDDKRRVSLSDAKVQHASGHGTAGGYTAHSSTYPPTGPRPAVGGDARHRERVDRGAPSSTASSNVPSSTASGHTSHTSHAFPTLGAVVESPKPISPAGAQPSPSGHESSSGLSLPSIHPKYRKTLEQQIVSSLSLPPHENTSMSSAPNQITGPRARDENSVAQPRPEPQTQTQTQPQPQTQTQPQPQPQGREQSAAPPPGPGNSLSTLFDNSNNLFASGEPGMWAYLQHLDDKVKQLTTEVEVGKKNEAELMEKIAASEERVASLTGEVASLRQQLLASQAGATALQQQ